MFRMARRRQAADKSSRGVRRRHSAQPRARHEGRRPRAGRGGVRAAVRREARRQSRHRRPPRRRDHGAARRLLGRRRCSRRSPSGCRSRRSICASTTCAPASPAATSCARATCYRLTRNVAFTRAVAYHDDEADPIATSMGTFMLGTKPGRSKKSMSLVEQLAEAKASGDIRRSSTRCRTRGSSGCRRALDGDELITTMKFTPIT